MEQRVREPMFQLHLFGIRPFAAGNIAGLLSSIGRGGLMFMLIIWVGNLLFACGLGSLLIGVTYVPR